VGRETRRGPNRPSFAPRSRETTSREEKRYKRDIKKDRKEIEKERESEGKYLWPFH
jgi:hypothetical protein